MLVKIEQGVEITDYLGVVKWEPYMPPQLAGYAKGNFPSGVMKSDQERCHNLKHEIFNDWFDHKWEVSLKMDGSSMTVYNIDGDIGVCSRNLDLKLGEENADNSFVKMFHSQKFDEIMEKYGRNIAFQGELCGPGIQGNREKFKEPKLFIFNIQELSGRKFFTPSARLAFIRFLKEYGYEVDHVPVLHYDVTLSDLGITDFQKLIDFSEGPSMFHDVREGLVFKSLNDPDVSFKAISPKFLLSED